MSYCSPKRNKLKKDKDTCLDIDIINEMVHLFNQSKKDVKIDPDLSDSEKLKKLEQLLSNEMPCSKEYCLPYAQTLKPIGRRLKAYYRPSVPKEWRHNNRTWLNTLDLLANLSQYNEAYPDFHFLTVSPIDFDTRFRSPFNLIDTCVDRNLCALDISKYSGAGKKKFGAVFNLDKHNQSGSHWTSMYIDLNIGEAYYFDSVAGQTPPEVVALLTRIAGQANDLVKSGMLNYQNLNDRLKLGVENNRAMISLGELVQYLLLNNNFINNRYGYLFDNVPKSKFSMEVTEETATKIVKKVLDLIDITKKEGYSFVPDLDHLLENHREKVDDFVLNWTTSQLSIALSNLISSIKVLSDDDNKYFVNNWQIEGSKIVLETSDIIKGKQLVDVSMKCFRNFVQHQFKNTECGMYSIHFIDTMLASNKTFNDIVLNPLSDEYLNSLRYSKYFTPQ